MIVVEQTLVNEEILEKKFLCDLNACKGACCIAGESGAPLEKEELPILEEILPKVKPFMVPKGIKAIEKQGPWVKDSDGDYTTTLVGKEAACAFVYFDEKNIAKCAIEKAHAEGIINWQKPISCHLYPIRVTRQKQYEVLNYSRWSVCRPACVCGEKMDLPIYKFLKAPLIRKYGKKWYAELERIASHYLSKNK